MLMRAFTSHAQSPALLNRQRANTSGHRIAYSYRFSIPDLRPPCFAFNPSSPHLLLVFPLFPYPIHFPISSTSNPSPSVLLSSSRLSPNPPTPCFPLHETHRVSIRPPRSAQPTHSSNGLSRLYSTHPRIHVSPASSLKFARERERGRWGQGGERYGMCR